MLLQQAGDLGVELDRDAGRCHAAPLEQLQHGTTAEPEEQEPPRPCALDRPGQVVPVAHRERTADPDRMHQGRSFSAQLDELVDHHLKRCHRLSPFGYEIRNTRPEDTESPIGGVTSLQRQSTIAGDAWTGRGCQWTTW